VPERAAFLTSFGINRQLSCKIASTGVGIEPNAEPPGQVDVTLRQLASPATVVARLALFPPRCFQYGSKTRWQRALRSQIATNTARSEILHTTCMEMGWPVRVAG
jgi:hypothetical protein